MKKIIGNRAYMLTVVAFLLLGILGWGISFSQSDDSEAQVMVVDRFEIAVAPALLSFDRDGSVGGALYNTTGDVYGGDTDVYGDVTIRATVTSDPYVYTVYLESTRLYHETNVIGDEGAATNLRIQNSAIEIDIDGAGTWGNDLGAPATVTTSVDPAVAGIINGYDVDFRLAEIPVGLTPGRHRGTLTFDLTTL